MSVVAFAVAGLVAFAALMAAGGPDEAAPGLRVAPFAAPAVAAAHVLAALPFVALVAVAVGRKLPCVAWTLIGTAVAAGTVFLGHELGSVLEDVDAGFPVRCLMRAAWCAALAVPWAAAGVRQFGSAPPARIHLRLTAAAGLAAACVPAAHVVAVGAAASDDLADLLRRQRLTAALYVAEELCRLGTGRATADVGRDAPPSPTRVRDDLRARVAELERSVRRPLPPDSPDAVVIDRAAALARLDRFAEAEALARPRADRNPDAELLLAAVLQSAGRFDESSVFYARAVGRHVPFLRPEARSVPAGVAAVAGLPAGVTSDLIVTRLSRSSPEACRRGYDGLAYNARERRDAAAADAAYQEALAALPGHRAYFHYQFGLHCRSGDRPADALAHFRQAARLDPAYAANVTIQVRAIRSNTPSCLPGGSVVGF